MSESHVEIETIDAEPTTHRTYSSDYEFSKMQIFTIVGICFFIYHINLMGHEILGHGIMGCLAVGFQPEVFTSTFIICSNETRPFGWVNAAGTFENFAIGLMFLLLWILYRVQYDRDQWGTMWYVLGLFAYLNFLTGAGYMMTSPLLPFGDWQGVFLNVPNSYPARIVVTIIGIALCIGLFVVAYRMVQPMLGKDPQYRFRRGLWLFTLPYGVNSVVGSLSSALIIGPKYIAPSLAGSLGSHLLFGMLGPMVYFARRRKLDGIWIPDKPLTVEPSLVWIALGILALISHVLFAIGAPWGDGPRIGWGGKS